VDKYLGDLYTVMDDLPDKKSLEMINLLVRCLLCGSGFATLRTQLESRSPVRTPSPSTGRS